MEWLSCPRDPAVLHDAMFQRFGCPIFCEIYASGLSGGNHYRDHLDHLSILSNARSIEWTYPTLTAVSLVTTSLRQAARLCILRGRLVGNHYDAGIAGWSSQAWLVIARRR
jgi:hypothetical protein